MSEGTRGPERIGRIAGAVALSALLPGCIDLPAESKTLIQVFVVLLSVNTFLQVVLIGLIVFYFLPFTRPVRKRRKR